MYWFCHMSKWICHGCTRVPHPEPPSHLPPHTFELWCWRRLWRVPWIARRSNQLILKEISPGCSLEGLMLKLKPQYFGHLIQSANSLEKTLMLGKVEGMRRRGQQKMRQWLVSFRLDWFDLLAVQRTLKSLLQHYSSKASILRCWVLFLIQLSHSYTPSYNGITFTQGGFVFTFEAITPLDSKEIKPVNPKGNQPWIFTGRTDAEAKAPTLWPPDVKRLLIGKYPDAGKDGRQKKKGVAEDEMVR